jgi:uncharacterized ferritin-like protein (DUF455 family)
MAVGRDFFALAEECLYDAEVETKLAVTSLAEALLHQGGLTFDPGAKPPRPAETAQFPERPSLVHPKDLPRRALHTTAGRIAFLHAIAHIEFTAIQLAWDMAYRFRGMPESFYRDWLGVAIEEAAHFRLLDRRLGDFGSAYGDLPAHRGLWELAEETAGDILARLALIPRFMEARGLDVTPGMIAKLEDIGDGATADLLRIILRDEIGHVACGTQWFRYVCAKRYLDPEDTYIALVTGHIRGFARGEINEEARLAAGFSREELLRLKQIATISELSAHQLR